MYLYANLVILMISTVWGKPAAPYFQKERTMGEASKSTIDGLIKLNKRCAWCKTPVGLGVDLLLHGLKAQRLLLKGAKTVSPVGPHRQFSKPGGLSQALTDFYKVRGTEVKEFTTPTGAIGKKTLVGDRKIVFTSRNIDGMPSIEITKVRNLKTRTNGHPDVPDQLLTDKIVYTNDYPLDMLDF